MNNKEKAQAFRARQRSGGNSEGFARNIAIANRFRSGRVGSSPS